MNPSTGSGRTVGEIYTFEISNTSKLTLLIVPHILPFLQFKK